jgi:phosphomannomutase
MQPDKVFKRYDVRGRYPEELDEEFVERMGKSVGRFIIERGEEKVVVCRDSKESSEGLKDELISGIVSTGVDVLDVGEGTTDYAAFCGSKEEAVSVQVTSSHMPLEFNGLKFMYPEGNGFLNDDLDRLEEFFHAEDFPQGSGRLEYGNYREEYIEEILEFVRENGANFGGKIVIDTMGGAAKDMLPEVLERLGFEVFDLGKYREGVYRNPPDPRPEKLEELRDAVEATNAYIGIATDLDGDRVKILFDGGWITGDDLFCVFSQLFDGKAVASIDTSEKLEEFGEVDYTRVGDPFVIDRMIEEDAVLSGEPNGHFCFPQVINYNSGIIAGALAASLDHEKKLGNIPDSFYRKRNLEYPDMDERDEAMQRCLERKDDVEVISEIDGLKFSYSGASVLVRPSGSSPKIRIKSEGASGKKAEEGLDRALELLGKE